MAHAGVNIDTSAGEVVIRGTISPGTDAVNSSIRAGSRARAFIRRASQQHHKIPLVYRETLSSLLTVFGNLKYLAPSGKIVPIKCVHGNPERIASKMTEQTNIILPIISVTQTTSEDDPARRRYEPTLVHQKYWDKDKNKAIRVLSLTPKAIGINYSVNIWSKYRSDMDQILEQIRLMFNPELHIETSFAQNTKAYLLAEADNSDVATGDKEDRVLKRGVSLVVQTYLPNPRFLITSTGEIERFNSEVEIYDKPSESTIPDTII
tara:strand:- start:1855 stop:2646 length:792 start_codon:yes stop_codon:yes gene_type:complete